MTKPIEYDRFPLELQDCKRRFFAVLLEDVTVETGDPDIDRVFERGLYSFDTKKAQKSFTKGCNADKEDLVAYSLNRKPMKGNENEQA